MQYFSGSSVTILLILLHRCFFETLKHCRIRTYFPKYTIDALLENIEAIVSEARTHSAQASADLVQKTTKAPPAGRPGGRV